MAAVYRSPNTLPALLACCLLLAGCSPPVPGPGPQSIAELLESENEQWSIILLSGERIGWAMQSQQIVEQAGERLLVTRQEIHTSIERGGDITEQKLLLESTTTMAGELRGFSQSERGGLSTTTVTGEQVNGELHIRRGETVTTISWNPGHGGFFSVAESLQETPLQPGETRTVTELTPQLLKPGNVSLKAFELESIATPGGLKRLLKVQRKDSLATGELISWMWIDTAGTIHAARTEGIELWQFLASREQAMQPLVRTGNDLLKKMMVPVDRPLPNAPDTRRVVYRLHLKRPVTDPVCVDSSQEVRQLDPRTYEIDVHPPGRTSQLVGQPLKPTAGDLATSQWIQSSDVAIIEQAERVLAGSGDPWKVALAMETHVHKLIEQKDYSQAFATARDVLESRQGDCTEHAVLLAALCRARQIPTRIAVGIVYVPGETPGFGYHMWNEVWIDDRWIGLDAMAGRGGVGAGRIKILDTDLGNGEAQVALVSLLSWIGQGRLEIISTH